VDWHVFEQASYTGNDNRKLLVTDKVVPGKGYWIQTLNDVNMTISLEGPTEPITQTATVAKTSFTGVTSSAFDNVMYYALPNSQADRQTKVLIGNPFHKKYQLSDMHYNHNGGTYYPMGDVNNDIYVKATVYTHDSNNTSSANSEYIAITPTPGFEDVVEPSIGFFLIMEVDASEQSNSVVFPLEK
jgi:hypothetical protein